MKPNQYTDKSSTDISRKKNNPLLNQREYIFDSDKIEIDTLFAFPLESYPYITVDYNSSTASLSGCALFCYNLTNFYRKHVIVMKTLLFLSYYSVGIIYYSSTQGYDFIDCVYFITETITCIGTGYFHPVSVDNKLFTIPYLIIGATLMIYLATDLVRHVLADAQDELIMFLFYSYYPRSVRLTRRLTSYYHIILTIIAVLIALLAATLFYHGNEEWGYIDSFYWSVCLMTTVGYGMCDLTITYVCFM